MNKINIIGITGTNASGKGTATSYIKKKYNLQTSSLSDIIREKLNESNKNITRESQIDLGNKLRRDFGNQILAELTLKKIKESIKVKNNTISYSINKDSGDKIYTFVIESIRNTDEIKFLKKNSDKFFLLGIDADKKTRFERNVDRKKTDMTASFEEFMRLEELENKNVDKHSQEQYKCLMFTDTIINNNGTVEEFYSKIDDIVESTGFLG